MLELQNDNLGEYLNQSDKTFVMFGASWCGACKMSKPKVKRLSSENQDIQFIYVDSEVMTESRKLTNGLENLPTFVSFKGTEMVEKEPGTKSIDKVLNSLK